MLRCYVLCFTALCPSCMVIKFGPRSSMKTSRYSLEHRSLHHGLNNRLRHVLMRLMRANKSVVENSPVEFDPQSVRKILLIRATYRIGDAVLATPAVELFRTRFPSARIDFVGGPICAVVFSHLAIEQIG